MKLTARQEIDAPAEFAFRTITQIDQVEQMGRDRGAEVRRLGPFRSLVTGAAWDVLFDWRGRRRQMRLIVTQVVPDQLVMLDGSSSSVLVSLSIEVVPIRAARCRLVVAVEVKPQTLAARLFVQSMKLIRSRISKRMDNRLRKIGNDIAARYARMPVA